MGEDVKGPTPPRSRTYDASGRRERARATRAAVLVAARELVEARGFTATTIADVAARAGVSPESVYKGFGTKAALVKAVFDITIAGDDEPVAVADRMEVQRVRNEPDVTVKLRLYAALAVARSARSAPLQLALRNGASSDPAIAALWGDIQAERLHGMAMVADHLLATGQLRTGLALDEVRDVLWASVSVEVYDLLVLQRGWRPEAFEAWLARTLVASLTDEPPRA